MFGFTISSLFCFVFCTKTFDGAWDDLFSSTEVWPETTTDDNDILNYTFRSNCSALNSFIAVTNPSSMRDTLLSEQALFEPYVYHLEATELVLLDLDDNNACFKLDNDTNHPSNIVLTTDISGKAVLIWHGNDYSDNTYNCSDESKVYILGNNGATAVLIANNKDTDIVEYIERDYTFENRYNLIPSIPARMITEEDGWYLSNYIESQSGIITITDSNSNSGTGGGTGGIDDGATADTDTTTDDSYGNGTLLIEMSCLDNDFPSIICVVDGNGRVWFMDGEYEQEASEILSYNSHPVYKKEGYFGMSYDLYMYLQTSSELGFDYKSGNSDSWHWVVAYEVGASTSSDIVAYCNATSLDPSKCETWQTWKSSTNTAYMTNNKIWINDTICNIEENYVCLDSETYYLSGVGGSYNLLTTSEPLWFRVLTEDDMTPSILFFDNTYRPTYYFYVVDTIDYTITAWCRFTTTSITKKLRFSPHLCDTWYVVKDSTTNDQVYYLDDSFFINNETCNDSSTFIEGDNAQDLCMQDITLNHGFLEGDYHLLNMTTSSGRGVWYNEDDSGDYDVYLWYYGDVEDDALMWVMTDGSPESNNYGIYAYCNAMVNHPSDCNGCWFFYYNGDWDPDCGASLEREACPSPATTLEPEDLPIYLCLSFPTLSNNNPYAGTYLISSSIYPNDTSKQKVGGKYYWSQIIDLDGESQSDTYHVIYDSSFGYWLFAYDTDGVETSYLKCTDYDGNNPANCGAWKDFNTNNEFDLEMREANCNITSPPTTTTTDSMSTTIDKSEMSTSEYDSVDNGDSDDGSGSGGSGSSNTGGSNDNDNGDSSVAGIVIGTIGVLLCLFIVGLVYTRRQKKGQAGFGAPVPSDNDIEMHRNDNLGIMSDDQLASSGSPSENGGFGTLAPQTGADDNGEAPAPAPTSGQTKGGDDDDYEESESSKNSDDIVKPENATTKGNDNDNNNNNEEELTIDGDNNNETQNNDFENDNGWTKF